MTGIARNIKSNSWICQIAHLMNWDDTDVANPQLWLKIIEIYAIGWCMPSHRIQSLHPSYHTYQLYQNHSKYHLSQLQCCKRHLYSENSNELLLSDTCIDNQLHSHHTHIYRILRTIRRYFFPHLRPMRLIIRCGAPNVWLKSVKTLSWIRIKSRSTSEPEN